MELVRPRATKRGLETPLELWGFFVEACRRNLHIVLCFSPIGNAFRERLRANPSIVNCCTIDWWGGEAARRSATLCCVGACALPHPGLAASHYIIQHLAGPHCQDASAAT